MKAKGKKWHLVVGLPLDLQPRHLAIVIFHYDGSWDHTPADRLRKCKGQPHTRPQNSPSPAQNIHPLDRRRVDLRERIGHMGCKPYDAGGEGVKRQIEGVRARCAALRGWTEGDEGAEESRDEESRKGPVAQGFPECFGLESGEWGIGQAQ